MDRERERKIVIEGRKQGKSDEFIKQAVIRDRERRVVNTPATVTQREGAANIPVIKQLSDFGVSVGSNVAKAGLGLGQVFLKGANVIGNVMGMPRNQYDDAIAGIEKFKTNVYDKPFEQEKSTLSGTLGSVVGEAVPYFAGSGAVSSGQKAVTGAVSRIPAVSNLAKFGRGALGVAGRAGVEAVGAGLTGYAATGGDIERAKSDALIGGAFSAGFGTLGALGRGARESGLAKNILSKTTGISPSAFDDVAGGINKVATPEGALEQGRKSVINLRAKTTSMWQDELPKIADEFKDVRKELSDSQIAKLAKVVDEFGVDESLLPVNVKNMSVLESMNLMKGLNELDSLAVKTSSKGAIVRQLRKELREEVLNTFGGQEGKVGKLWKNYAIKSKILDDMNDIVNAYKTTPRATVTAKNRLMAIYDANKPEFLKAVKDIEEELGINITRDVASTKFKNILPEGILKADGGLPTKSGIVDKLIKALFLPVTSPRIAGRLVTGSPKEAGVLKKRLFGNYSESGFPPKRGDVLSDIQAPNRNIPISTQIDTIKTPITPNITNIPTSLPQVSKEVKKSIPNRQGGFISTGFKNEGDLTTKILKDLEGKTTVSKQYILDATNRGELKQVERDLIRRILDESTPKGEKVLHGTGVKFDSFDDSMRGSLTGAKSAKGAIWFTDDLATAKAYSIYSAEEGVVKKALAEADELEKIAKRSGKESDWAKYDAKVVESEELATYENSFNRRKEANVKEAYIDGDLYEVDAKGKSPKELSKEGDIDSWLNEQIEKANKLGKDGVKIKNLDDAVGLYDRPATHYAIFDSKKINTNSDTINVSDFAKKVKAELLPLKVKATSGGYEGRNLPDELRGNVKNYYEHTWESPIQTSAGEKHSGLGGSKNYFAHTRVEDLADDKTRRIIEAQSDLYQKKGLEKELTKGTMPYKSSDQLPIEQMRNNGYTEKQIQDAIRDADGGNANIIAKNEKRLARLKKYSNQDRSWFFRTAREEIRKASQDGKTKLQFPTGETSMKIEGLGDTKKWIHKSGGEYISTKPDNLRVGMEITQTGEPDWIITDVLGDGKFKAVSKSVYDRANLSGFDGKPMIGNSMKEEFDISGKVDTNNPIYKFYEKDVQKYLNKFGGKRIVDDKGVSWIEIPITKEQGSSPVEAFGKSTPNVLLWGAGISGAGVVGSNVYQSQKKSANLPKRK